MKIAFCTNIAALIFLLSPALSWGQVKITLYYNDRPPYLVSAADGAVTGLTATPATNACKSTGIDCAWVKMPTNRQLAIVKENIGMDCAVGWFKNPEREKFAKFTKPIYRDKPTVALVSKQFLIKEGRPLEAVLAGKGVRVLVKEGFSYGAFLDDLLARLKPTIVSTAVENIQMVQMIRADRADFMFVAEEEASYLVEQAGFSIKNFRLLNFPDMPNGEKRHIMCSKQVSDDVIGKLNKGIAFEK